MSNYGPLGFYDPERCTITINRNTHKDPVETIKHEMIHLMVEPYIRKYELSFGVKESIVDSVYQILSQRQVFLRMPIMFQNEIIKK